MGTVIRRHAVRLAIVVSHPIQHFVPLYKRLAGQPGLDVKVFYGSTIGAEPYFDRDMNVTIQWKQDLLSGYDHEFLAEAEAIHGTGFWQVDNPSVTKALAGFRPDIVLLYGYAQATAVRALMWCRRNRIPALMVSDSELHRSRGLFRRLAKRIALHALFTRYAALLSTGDSNEAYLWHYGVSHAKIFRSPFPIDEDVYRQARRERAMRRKRYRSKLDVPDDAFVVVAVGKLSPRKRPRDILAVAEALAAVGNATRPIHFVLAGDGVLMPNLAEQVRSRGLPVHLLGFINVDELPDVYCCGDALVHASESDPHPLVLSEAAAIGLPLVVSDKVGALGPTDIAQPGRNALVFACGDRQRMARYIAALRDDKKLHQRMSAASLAVYESQNMAASIRGLTRAIRFVTGITVGAEAADGAMQAKTAPRAPQ